MYVKISLSPIIMVQWKMAVYLKGNDPIGDIYPSLTSIPTISMSKFFDNFETQKTHMALNHCKSKMLHDGSMFPIMLIFPKVILMKKHHLTKVVKQYHLTVAFKGDFLEAGDDATSLPYQKKTWFGR